MRQKRRLTKSQKKEFIRLAFPCLMQTRPNPESLKKLKQALKTGIIDEKILKKYFPKAYVGISSKVSGLTKMRLSDPVRSYFLEHNEELSHQKRYPLKEAREWCKISPAVIAGKKGKYYMVSIQGKEVKVSAEAYPGVKIVNEKKLKEGTLVLIHRGAICEIVSPEKAVKFLGPVKRKLKA